MYIQVPRSLENKPQSNRKQDIEFYNKGLNNNQVEVKLGIQEDNNNLAEMLQKSSIVVSKVKRASLGKNMLTLAESNYIFCSILYRVTTIFVIIIYMITTTGNGQDKSEKIT